jgi:flavin-dependent thymidylate synthase
MLNVRLISKPSVTPTDLIAASARTCYSNTGGLVLPDQVTDWSKKNELIESIVSAGHHTTFQHVYITLGITGISRQLIYRLLHNHPNYNSEQLSQRYVGATKSNTHFVYPVTTPENKAKWEEYYNTVMEYYHILNAELVKVFETMLHGYTKKQVTKKAQEFARYVLPQGITASLYHTINLMTALRYIAVAKALPEANDEAIRFSTQLEHILLDMDPDLRPYIEKAKNTVVKYPVMKDSEKVLTAYRKHSKNNVNVFSVTGSIVSTDNESYSNILNLYTVMPDNGILGAIDTYIELSLSADAQNQRHRTSPAYRPTIEETFVSNRYYIPDIVKDNDHILKIYEKAMHYMYNFFHEQVSTHIGTADFGEAVYALPNAHMVEILQKDDFSNFLHKGHMRLCLNSQEEIRKIVTEQLLQIPSHITNKDYINILRSVSAPCIHRHNCGIKPYCPEGDRFCGVKLWTMDKKEVIEFYKRHY